MTFEIRHIQKSDLKDVVEILNFYISSTAITFDTQEYNEVSRLPWYNQFSTKGRHQCLVALENNKVVGYACSSAFRPKEAYNTSVEVSIYTNCQCKKRGLGTLLYTELFTSLKDEDIHRALALITVPNEASIALHEKFGFIKSGILDESGRKFNQFHSVCIMQKSLS